MTKTFYFIVTVITVVLGYKINSVFELPPLPTLSNEWWGPGEPGSTKSDIRRFSINISDAELADLQWRLAHRRPFTPPLEGVQQQYGMNTKLLEEIVQYWENKYNWKEREKYLNKFPQFKINIQGLDIHFLHVKPKDVPKNVKILPLLLLHGWPGSVREFYGILPELTTPKKDHNFVFEVIAPHIPGYGFSQAAVRPGLGALQIAVVFKNMMQALGFKRYYAQGGDFGSTILFHMSKLFPDVVLGFHSNMCYSFVTIKGFIKDILSSIAPWVPSWYVRPEHYNRVFPISSKYATSIREMGYMHLQATKPDTIGVAMADSPVGLAAYILEKFTTGTNTTWQELEDGGLKNYFSYDDLLDNIMIYWWTRSATTSFRLYAETLNPKQLKIGITRHPVLIPAACARFRYDFYQSDGQLQDMFTNLLQLSDYEGGHFAAFQLPEVLATDIFNAVEKFEKFNKETKRTI